MGMFPVQNYGADFVNSMAATAGMVNDRERLGIERQRQARADKSQDLQDQATTQNIEANKLKLGKERDEMDREKLFTELFTIKQRKAVDPNYQYSDDDIRTAGKALGLTPGVPNDPAQFPVALKNMNTLLGATQTIRNIPPGFHIVQRGENPQYDAVFDAQQSLLSQDHVGQSHTDKDGSVTGKPGTVYKTAGIGGAGILSGNGDKAAFLPLYSVAYADGTPIIDPATGKPKLVPRTEGRSNDPNDRLSPLTPDNLQMMVGARVAQMKTIEDMIAADPKNREKILEAALQSSMGTEEKKKLAMKQMEGRAAADALRSQVGSLPDGIQKQQIETAISLLDSGAAATLDDAVKLAKIGKPDKTSVTLAEGAKMFTYDPATGGMTEVAEGNPKRETPHTAPIGVGNGMEQTFQYNAKTGRYDIPLGKPTAKFKASEGGESKLAKNGRRDIKEIVDEYQALKSKRDAQYAKDTEELRHINAQRVAASEPQLTFQQYFGGKSSPAHAAITQDMYQLRDVAAQQHGYDLINMTPMGKAAPQQRQAAPAQTAKGMNQSPQQKQQVAPITITNHTTGERRISYDNGQSWKTIQQPASAQKQAAPRPAQPAPKPQPKPQPQPRKAGFFDEVADKSKGMRQEKAVTDAAKARAAAANTSPNDYVTAYNKQGQTFRTKAGNATFNTSTLRWEMKG